MEVFVTGATGFIGSALVARLLDEGHHVRAYVRSPDRAREQLGPKPSFVVALGGPLGGPHSHATPELGAPERDSLRRAAIRAGLSGADAVVHLAGESIIGRWTEEKRERIHAGRSGLGGQIVDAIGQVSQRPKILVVASAVGVYGDRGDEPLDEGSVLGDDFLATVCKKTEAEANRARLFGTRVAALRFGVVLGARGGLLKRLVPLHRAGLGAVMGDGRQHVSWIALDDVVEIILRAIHDVRFDGPVNVVTPLPTTQRQFAKALGRELSRPVFLRFPGWLMKPLAGGLSTLFLGSQRVMPMQLSELGYTYLYPTLETALAAATARGAPGGAEAHRSARR